MSVISVYVGITSYRMLQVIIAFMTKTTTHYRLQVRQRCQGFVKRKPMSVLSPDFAANFVAGDSMLSCNRPLMTDPEKSFTPSIHKEVIYYK